MKNYLRRMSLCLLVAGLLGFGPAGATAETIITSADFSFAFGAAPGGATVWNDVENAATNTLTTQGDFTFAPAPTGPVLSNTGPVFTNRTLSNGTSTQLVGIVWNFEVPIVASYNGAVPADADPDLYYALEIEITKISIYGSYYPNYGPTTMRWDETTADHAQNSASIDLKPSSGTALKYASNYTQLVWDPDDYSLPLASLNDSAMRTFDIINANVDNTDFRHLDGMEIEGRVILLYNIVPEPSTVMLVLSGLLAIGLSIRRKLG